MIATYLAEADKGIGGAQACETERSILKAAPAVQASMLLPLAVALADVSHRRDLRMGSPHRLRIDAIRSLLDRLLRRPFELEDKDLRSLLSALRRMGPHYGMEVPLARALGIAERHVQAHGVSDALKKTLIAYRKMLARYQDHAVWRKSVARVDVVLGGMKVQIVEAGDAWANRALADLASMPAMPKDRWMELIQYAATAEGSAPSSQWLRGAAPLIKRVGQKDFLARSQTWFALVGRKGTHKVQRYNDLILERNADILKGLVWCHSGLDSDRIPQSMGDLAAACFQKVPGIGPRNVKVGSACITVLAAMSGMSTVAQLSRLKLRVKHCSALRQIQAALDAVAAKAGLTTDDLEDAAVPSFGMEAPGLLRKNVGGSVALMRLVDTTSTELTWLRSDGREQDSVPAAVKTGCDGELAELRDTARAMKTMALAQRDRIEGCYLRTRRWSLGAWRRTHLDHPLVGTLARRLVWHFQKGARRGQGIWCDGRIVDAAGKPLGWIDDQTQVSLWHPIGFDAQTILAWRNWLENHQVRQPFKQAHREIYVLTDAELKTRTRSNRFAAHIIKQHQFARLCQQRGWRYRLIGTWDSDNTPFLDLPQWRLRAEFWVAGIGEYGKDTSDAGVCLTLSTDQVRFLNPAGQLLALTEIPAIVLTEVLRDVDLFVGVCSVGNDPTWRDQAHGEARVYWQEFSFGDLSESAKTRRGILEGLLPKLKIASRCTLSDKFLVVQGELRTYKIHLGSGNILMWPNDQYLCIVPDRSSMGTASGDRIFLPFEGDDMLSLILSKALMLADDTKIKEPSILNQIKTVK